MRRRRGSCSSRTWARRSTASQQATTSWCSPGWTGPIATSCASIRATTHAPARGVFATRSPDRPNPIGLHRVRVVEVDGLRLRVRDLEALDGTPVVDVKPVLRDAGER